MFTRPHDAPNRLGKSFITLFLRFLMEYLGDANDRVKGRSKFVAHICEKLALCSICRLGLLARLLKFDLTALQLGNIGVNDDRAVIMGLAVGDADPEVVPIRIFGDAVRR